MTMTEEMVVKHREIVPLAAEVGTNLPSQMTTYISGDCCPMELQKTWQYQHL